MLPSAPRVQGVVSQESAFIASGSAEREFANTLLAKDQLVGRECGQPADFFHFDEIDLQPLERRNLALELGIPGDAKPGNAVVFEFRQSASGFLLGGYTVVVLPV